MAKHADLTVLTTEQLEEEIRITSYKLSKRICESSLFESEVNGLRVEVEEMLVTMRESHFAPQGRYPFDLLTYLISRLLDDLVLEISSSDEVMEIEPEAEDIKLLRGIQESFTYWPNVVVTREEGGL